MARLCDWACRHGVCGRPVHVRWWACAHGRRLAWACRCDRVHHVGRKGFAAGALDLSWCGRRRCDRAGDAARAHAAEGKSAMTNLATVFGRVPELVLFGAAGLIQIALIGLMVADRVMILRTGVDVTLQTRPLDPRDFLRGDYVVLGYDISSVRAGDMASGRLTGRDKLVFVKLAPNRPGFYEAISVHPPPATLARPSLLIRGHVVSGVNCGRDHCSFDRMPQ